MLNVLYLINFAGKAGTERYVQLLAEKLKDKKTKPYFVYNIEGLLVERMKALNIDTFQMKLRFPFDLLAAWKLAKLCKKLKIDIIHAQFLRENYIALLSKIFNPKVKVFYTNHFILKNSGTLRFFNRLMTRLQSRIIAVCNKGKEVLTYNGNNPEIISVIFNGVEINTSSQPTLSTFRSDNQIEEDVFLLLCASRFADDKGHKYLVNSINELVKMTDKKFKLILAGDGPLLEEVKSQVSDLNLKDIITFTGFVKDMKNLLLGCDLYVNSSAHEALSFLIIEALAAGLPVVATDMGGNNDIINARTNCGVLVEYDNPLSTAKALKKLMEEKELYIKLKGNTLKAVDTFFNIDKIVEQTYNLYESSITKQ